MAAGPDSARPGIGSQWIKANAIGAGINVVMTLLAFLFGRMLGVNDPGAAGAVQAIFVVIATAMLAFGMTALGYLSGVVLRTRLPAFPMRGWLALFLVLGLVFGALSAYAWLSPDSSQDLGTFDPEIVASLAIGAAIVGAAIGAVLGSVQALVLRRAAQGLGLWIACCAVAGTLFALVVPAVAYGPQSSFATEATMNATTLAITVLASFILLPAVHRLRPR